MLGHPREQREWDPLPLARTTDDGIRHKLKALFSPTDGDEPPETVVEERAREVEEQAQQLQVTIDDLERREEQAAKLRAAVEEMLRHGSTELDERHTELTALALDLRAREDEIRKQERDLAVRTQELGAVELRRAAVERREEAVTAREAALEQAIHVEPPVESVPVVVGYPALRPVEDEPEISAHVLWVVEDGYRIVARDGRAPDVDETVDVDGRSFVVTRVGRSTLPDDTRVCAFLEPTRDAL